MKNPRQTTLLINLSVDEADQIRAAAKRQDRTISALVLRAVMTRIKVEAQVQSKESFLETYVQRARGDKG